MALMELTLASEPALVWQWASAEINSARLGHLYRSLPSSIVSALDRGDQASLSERERTHLEHVVLGVRRPLLAGLRRLGTSWHAGRVLPEDLEDLRLLKLPVFLDLSRSLRLGELVRALDRGESSTHDKSFSENYRDLRAAFDIGRMRGAPVLVGMRPEGPYEVLEGYSRLAVLLSNHFRGNAVPEVNVILGVCGRIQEWRLDDSPCGLPLYWA